MECVHKILIKKSPMSDPIRVPCGQCIACRLNRASDWAVRIMHEKKTCGSASFVTLTYSDEHLPLVGNYATLVKRDVQLFLKRLRKEVAPKKIRYYLCGEYGERGHRPHYHLIVFGLSPSECETATQNCWHYGFSYVGTVTIDSAQYVARYCTKLLTGKGKQWYIDRNIIPEFSLMSRRPGIGAEWLEKYGREVKQFHNVVVKGKTVSPPRYYRDKVYDEVDRRIVSNGVLDKVIAQIKKELEYDKAHVDSSTWQDEVEQARKKDIMVRLNLKKRK